MTGPEGFELVEDGDPCVGRLVGEIDLANARTLGESILAAAAPACGWVVLDLTEVSYLDSSGVSMLVRVSRDLAQRRQQLMVLVGATSPLQRVFGITQLHQVIPMEESLEAALKRIEQAGASD